MKIIQYMWFMYLNHFRLTRQSEPFFCRHLPTLITALELIVRLFCLPRPLLLASQAIINAAIRIKSICNVSRTWKPTHKNINAYLKTPRQQHAAVVEGIISLWDRCMCVVCEYICVCVWATESAENYISWNFNRPLLIAANNQICAHPVDYLVYLPHPHTYTSSHTHTGAFTHKLLYTLTQIGAICQNPKDF